MRAPPRAPREAIETRCGLVVGAHGRHFIVEAPEGGRLRCHPRGKRSDAVVGDRVQWLPSGDEGVIEQVEPRRNLLFRQDAWRSKSFAANLNQLLLLLGTEPMHAEQQLARALIAAEDAGIPVLLALNKIDLPGTALARQRLVPYRAMGIEIVELALKTAGEAAHALLAPRLAGRVTLVLGPSGAGKSTLINRMVPAAGAQVGEISRALNAGRHTTTTTTWYWLDPERRSALIDSPGFQAFGLNHLRPARLAALMPDLRAHAQDCRFQDCSHRAEPGCAVRAAVERGEIDAGRYRIYEALYDELAAAR